MSQWTENRFRSDIAFCIKSTKTLYLSLQRHNKIPKDFNITGLNKIQFPDFYRFHTKTSDLSESIVLSRFLGNDPELNYSHELSTVIWKGEEPIGLSVISNTDILHEKFIYTMVVDKKFRHTWASVALKHQSFLRLAANGVSSVIYYAYKNNPDTIRHSAKIQRLSK
ncbi:MAG: hypothetical protein NXI20_18670 [bacterium]|nr:hypothetical protein [bacterium]